MTDDVELERVIRRGTVRSTIKACTSCNLVKQSGVNGPVPFAGPSNPSIVVVGEAPGKMEDAIGEPFFGPSGVKLKEWLVTAGYDMREVAFVNTVCCYPKRTPTDKEVEACRGNLILQLSFLRPRWIISVGGVATSALTGGLGRIGELRGLPYRPEGFGIEAWAMGTWHPAAVLRNHSLEDQALEDLEFWHGVIVAELDPPPLAEWCVKCKGFPANKIRGIPFCTRHTPKHVEKKGR